jgi:host factor-I protein
MDKTPQQNNIQDNFLNQARRERMGVTIYLISGVKLTGRIKSFDKYSLILEAGSQEQLIFKHAISTVSLPRSMHRPPGPGRPMGDRPPMGDRMGDREGRGYGPPDRGHDRERQPYEHRPPQPMPDEPVDDRDDME